MHSSCAWGPFGQLVKNNYMTDSETDTKTSGLLAVDEYDIDILKYIGGSIMHSIRDRNKPSGKQTHKTAAMHDILNCLESDNKTDITQMSLTRMLDRGSQTYLKQKAVDLFVQLECHFHQLKGEQMASGDVFSKKCIDDKDVTECFYQLCCGSLAGDADKEHALNLIIKLFFKIRMHHSCRQLMEAHRRKQNLSKKRKRVLGKNWKQPVAA